MGTEPFLGRKWESEINIFDALFCAMGTLGIAITTGNSFRNPGLDTSPVINMDFNDNSSYLILFRQTLLKTERNGLRHVLESYENDEKDSNSASRVHLQQMEDRVSWYTLIFRGLELKCTLPLLNNILCPKKVYFGCS